MERDLAELRSLGVPTSVEDLREREQGAVPIQEFETLLTALRNDPAYGPWGRASRHTPGTLLVADLDRAAQLQARMQPKFDELRSLIRKSQAGISWNWPEGNGWYPEHFSQFSGTISRPVAISRRRMAVELARGDLSAGLESVLDMQILTNRMYKMPGSILCSSSAAAHLYVMEGFTAVMQLGANNRDILERIDLATETESPDIDLRTLVFDSLVWAREAYDKPRLAEVAVKAKREGSQTLISELSSHRPNEEAELVHLYLKAHKRLVGVARDVNDFEATLGAVCEDLKSDQTGMGRIVSSLWPDPNAPEFSEVLNSIKKEKTHWALTRAALKVLQYRLENKSLPETLTYLRAPLDPVSKKPLSYSASLTGFNVAAPDGQTISISLPELPK